MPNPFESFSLPPLGNDRDHHSYALTDAEVCAILFAIATARSSIETVISTPFTPEFVRAQYRAVEAHYGHLMQRLVELDWDARCEGGRTK